jgi:hypothetical protein
MYIQFYLNALYAGLYQHRNEKGVKSIKYKIDRPNVVKSAMLNNNINPPSILRTITDA